MEKKIDGVLVEKEVYSIEQLAVYLQLSERYLRDIITKKKIKAYKKAKRWYIFHSDVIEWIKDGKD